MIREAAYDEVFDAQKHFRSLLDSTARPGKISRLDPVKLDPPSGLHRASALVAFALMDAESAFHTVNMNGGEAAYLTANTNARAAAIEDASFLFAQGNESPDFLENADCGTLLYPDSGATLVLQVKNASTAPLTDALKLTLQGPGIDGLATIFVRGLNPDLLLAIEARNAEFPLGLDSILTFNDESGAPAIAALPRTTHIAWEYCR